MTSALGDAINSAWADSNPDTRGQKREQGFWVYQNTTTGNYGSRRFPTEGSSRHSMRPGFPPAVAGYKVVAFFHTHPNTEAEGYVPNVASPSDLEYSKELGRRLGMGNLPGIFKSHDGVFYFNF